MKQIKSMGRASLVLALFLLVAQWSSAAVAFRAASSAGARSATAAYSSNSNSAQASSGNITPSVSADRNSVLVCVVTQRDNVAISFPTGWTQLYSLSQSANLRASVYYKISGNTESNPTITHPGGSTIVARCFRLRGVDAYSLLDLPPASLYSASSSTLASGSLSTQAARDWLLFVQHAVSAASVTQSPSGPGGVTWRSRFFTTANNSSSAPVGLATGSRTSAGLVGPITETLSSTTENFGVLLALRSSIALSIPIPVGTQANDVMVASITVTPATASVTAPAGWQVITSKASNSNEKSRLITYTKVATASEPAVYSWQLSTSHTGVAGGIASFSGVDTSNPVDVSATQVTSSGQTHVAPSLTTTASNGMLVTVHSLASSPYSTSSGTQGSWAPPSGMTEAVDERSRGSSNSNGVALEMAYAALSGAGATGTKSASVPSSSDVGVTAAIALRGTSGLDHLEIDYPQATLSSCVATTVTVRACASSGTSCASQYTGGVSGIVLTPGGGSLNIPAGSSAVSAPVSQSAGAGTLAASSPAPQATTCKNLSTSGFGCGVNFAATVLTMDVPNFVAGTGISTSATACTVPDGQNAVKFYSAYQDPSSGTLPVSVAPRTGGVCGSYTAVSTDSAAPTSINLNFSSNVAALCVNYPDVGKLNLVSAVGSATANSVFTAMPHHFAISSVSCVSGCLQATNPGATDASGGAFMKAGPPLSLTVGAYNGAATPALTPNFGKESVPATVLLTPQVAMADLAAAVVGDFNCITPSASCVNGALGTVVLGGFGSSAAGTATNTFGYKEVGIMKLLPSLYDAAGVGYLGSGDTSLNANGNLSGAIGRFVPDHFALTPDSDFPVATQSDFAPPASTLTTGTGAPASVIDIEDSTGFAIGARVRVVGAGSAGAPLSARITAMTATSLTLDSAISTTLDGGELVVQEWGTYMGEAFSARFQLSTEDADNATLKNYQGPYARLSLVVDAGHPNPLGLAAANGSTDLSSRLDTSSAATASFGADGAAVVAPLKFTRGVSPDGPYTALKIGIAPVDADGVVLGGSSAYDLNVGGTVNHTSIMDPLVQASTEVRYGRTRIANTYGSELLALLVPVTLQYWNGSGYVTSSDDATTALDASNFPLSAALGNLTQAFGTSSSGTCQPEPLPTALRLVKGIAKVCLPKPGVTGSVTLSSSAPTYLPSNAGLAKFGLFKSPLIYRRENY